MYSKLFVDAGPLLVLPILSLILFIAIFAMIVVRVMRQKPAELDALAALPLAEENGHE